MSENGLMGNVYDILHQKNLLFVLPEDVQKGIISEEVFSSAAVAVNLYYEDTLNRYLRYIDGILGEIDVYIISSNKKAWVRLEDFAAMRSNAMLLGKENRGGI